MAVVWARACVVLGVAERCSKTEDELVCCGKVAGGGAHHAWHAACGQGCLPLPTPAAVVVVVEVPKTAPTPSLLTTAEKVRLDNQKVLVHCMSGLSKSPAVVVYYLMRHRGWRLSEAYSWVKDRRPAISITAGAGQGRTGAGRTCVDERLAGCSQAGWGMQG